MKLFNPVSKPILFLPLISLLVILAAAVNAQTTKDQENGRIEGTWYLELNAEAFDLPPGSTLPGLVQFHSDRTLTILDAGDLGTAPFPTTDTSQMGHWTRRDGQVRTLTLFLQRNLTNEDVGWNKVEIELTRPRENLMEGLVNVSYLSCDTEAPFSVFFCPVPVEEINAFEPLPPENIPVSLTRLPRP
ncbi:MAG TPA: hypothetical protein VJ984_16785 [Xanthomonadales bacterium]|nr:hypothetical protein [Xanthomonadales bacterium]